MRRSPCPPAFLIALALACALGFPLSASRANADPLPALRAVPDELTAPGDPGWPLTERVANGARIRVSKETVEHAPGGLPSFRVEIAPLPGAKPGPLRACVGLASPVRRDLYKTRAVEFHVKASQPVVGFLTITSSNTENPAARDRFFGSFVAGQQWKELKVRYGTLSPLPGWPEEALRQGYTPGDLVLRPDSVEDICIGAEAGRVPEGGVTLHIGGLRFVR